MDSHQYCQTLVSRSGSSFYYSFVLLPRETRRAITAFYALCRELDDVVDECREAQVAAAKLNWWRSELAQQAQGTPQHPVTRALFDTPQGRALPQSLLQEIVDGMAMDLTRTRYSNFAELQVYCHRVAGVVGELAAQVFGYRNAETRAYANDLGLAFQLTNIIRDVGEDARRGRIYLPQDELQSHGVAAADIFQRRVTPAFTALMAQQVARARAFYARALAALPSADRSAQRPGLVMAAIYQALLRRIERDGFHVLDHRIALTPLAKACIAWKTSWSY